LGLRLDHGAAWEIWIAQPPLTADVVHVWFDSVEK
jgi:hypothetical protein